jgi:transcription initiation factor TFIIIB Brf1 subunit/transcription initiation factor TFIIB
VKECPKCGYGSVSKDSGGNAHNICPRCGTLYDEIGDDGSARGDSFEQKRVLGKEALQDVSVAGNARLSKEANQNFLVPRTSIIRSALTPSFLTLLWVLFKVPPILNLKEMAHPVLYLLFIMVPLIIVWLPFLFRPHELVLTNRQLTFRAPLRTFKVNVGDLIYIKDRGGGFSTRFKIKKKIIDVLNISEWDELIKIITRINPAVKVSRNSEVARAIGKWIYPVVMILLICSVTFAIPQLERRQGLELIVDASHHIKQAEILKKEGKDFSAEVALAQNAMKRIRKVENVEAEFSLISGDIMSLHGRYEEAEKIYKKAENKLPGKVKERLERLKELKGER